MSPIPFMSSPHDCTKPLFLTPPPSSNTYASFLKRLRLVWGPDSCSIVGVDPGPSSFVEAITLHHAVFKPRLLVQSLLGFALTLGTAAIDEEIRNFVGAPLSACLSKKRAVSVCTLPWREPKDSDPRSGECTRDTRASRAGALVFGRQNLHKRFQPRAVVHLHGRVFQTFVFAAVDGHYVTCGQLMCDAPHALPSCLMADAMCPSCRS